MIFKATFDKESNIPLSEYPRPQFKRDSYISLNGEWDYAITNSNKKPDVYDGKITVPYSPETQLSGVEKQVNKQDFLHYRKCFSLPKEWLGGRVLLNFGAVDQVCTVFLNGHELAMHKGGYNCFSVDLTDNLKEENELCLTVTDDAESEIYGRGKQSYKAGGIWYKATSGIWQSVWLENVPETYITGLKLIPSAIDKTLTVITETNRETQVLVSVYDGETLIEEGITKAGSITLNVEKCKLWSPDCPELYNLKIVAGKDTVFSYFGLRSFGITEIQEKKYFTLNGKPIFYNGILDQGYFEGGYYTPKDNQTMYEEIKNVKELGFNMLRKHIKVEPMLWYYYCDILGVAVWQDMINGGGKYSPLRIMLCPFFNLNIDDKNYKKIKRNQASRKQYMIEAKEMMNQLFNVVSLCLWTPFNEAWGQFDAVNVYDELSKLDTTRHFDHASGWQDKGVGDVNSKHIYFRKAKPKNDGKRVLALTEFGGYSFPVEGHVFSKRKFGYKMYKNGEKLFNDYKKLYETEVFPLIEKQGLGATVYTQLTDIEDEINGLYTFDRILKMPSDEIKKINKKLYEVFNNTIN